jgi:hypothetical protein
VVLPVNKKFQPTPSISNANSAAGGHKTAEIYG